MADINNGWVLFNLDDQQYGMPIRHLLQMVVMADVVKQRNAPPWYRGIITLRGVVIPVLDVRRRLGMKSTEEEQADFVDLMKGRKEDHVNWLSELASSMADNREFTLTTDPHACAFGKWYDEFKTDNPLLNLYMEQFDRPHKRVHAIAEEVRDLNNAGEIDKARQLIENTRHGELATMIKLFDNAGQALRESLKEIVLVMEQDGRKTGFLVDEVQTVRDISPDQLQTPQAIVDGPGANVPFNVADVNGVTSILFSPNELVNPPAQLQA